MLKLAPDDIEEQVVNSYLAEDIIESVQVQWVNNPSEPLNIEQVRSLIADLAYGSFAGKMRYFILSNIDSASLPAQHALLKSLEEPPANTQLILLSRQPESLLETITSRCQIIQLDSAQEKSLATDKQVVEVKNSLPALSYSQAIDLAAQYKDRDQALELVEQLTKLLHDDLRQTENSSTKNLVGKLSALLYTSKLLKANCNVRLTLEECFFQIRG